MSVARLLFIAALALPGCPQSGAPGGPASRVVIVRNGSGGGATLVADAVDSVTIAVAIYDDSGRPMENLPVRIEVTGSRNIVTPAPESVTDMNGLYIANLTTTEAGTKTIRVVADRRPGEAPLDESVPVVFRAGPEVRSGRDFFGNPTDADLSRSPAGPSGEPAPAGSRAATPDRR